MVEEIRVRRRTKYTSWNRKGKESVIESIWKIGEELSKMLSEKLIKNKKEGTETPRKI